MVQAAGFCGFRIEKSSLLDNNNVQRLVQYDILIFIRYSYRLSDDISGKLTIWIQV